MRLPWGGAQPLETTDLPLDRLWIAGGNTSTSARIVLWTRRVLEGASARVSLLNESIRQGQKPR